jgi:CheY-like chemotaxis protein
LNSNRVVLISDNGTSRFILQEMLQGFGLETDAYRLPADAVARLAALTTNEQPYSLAVIDVCTTGTDAFAVIAEIGRSGSTLPIVMLDSNARLGDHYLATPSSQWRALDYLAWSPPHWETRSPNSAWLGAWITENNWPGRQLESWLWMILRTTVFYSKPI